MPRNYYDQASRYTAKLDSTGFVRWLVGLPALVFHRWLDTRRLPFPGELDRVCDTVACVEDPATTGLLWAIPIEFALEPEADLFGRLLAYLGLLWLEERPSPQRGSRYQVGAVVVNLTGQGHTARSMVLATSGMRTCLEPVERDLASTDAAAILAGITAGTITGALLLFIPLMQDGGEAAIMGQWLQLA